MLPISSLDWSTFWPYGLVLFTLVVFLAIRFYLNTKAKRIELAEGDLLPTQWLDVEGLQIRYHQSGNGPDILLVHGIGSSLMCWRHLVPILSQNYTVTALDLPGFGFSSKPRNVDYGLDFQTQVLNQVLVRLGIETAHTVGCSMGGNIALWLARQYPEKVARVVLIAPALHRQLVPIGFNRGHWFSAPLSLVVNRRFLRWTYARVLSQQHRLQEIALNEIYETYLQNPGSVRSFILATNAIRDSRPLDEAHNVKSPVLTLWGEGDRLISRPVMDTIQNRFSTMKVHIHSSGGHHLQEDFPDWVAEKIHDFVIEKLD